MNRLLVLLTALMLAHGAFAKEAVPLADDPVIEKRLVTIAEELRCLVCQNESLAGSHAELAEDLRREVRTLMKEGKTDQEVKDFLVSRYGDFVLYRPPVKPTTWLLWLGPFLLLGGSVTAMVLYLKRRSRRLTEEPQLAEESPLSEDDL